MTVRQTISIMIAPLLVPFLLGSIAVAQQQGMVLQINNTNQYGDGPLTIKYLSNNETKILVSGNAVFGACFSPDGRQIAYPFNRQQLKVMNVDGSNQRVLCTIGTTTGAKEQYTSWATNGYIYWSSCDQNIYRIKADGSESKADSFFTSTKNVHNLSVNEDGTRATWTKPPPDRNGNDWWSNSIITFGGNEIDYSTGCQTSISPNGSKVTKSGIRHDYFFVTKFGPTTDAAWNNCSDLSCTNFVTSGPNPVGATYRHYMIRWPHNDSTKLLFTLEGTFDGYLYDWVAKTTPIRIGRGLVWDYYKTEIRNPIDPTASLVFTPANLVMNLTQGSTPDSAVVTASLKNSAAQLGTLTVTKIPAWLTVTVRGATLVCKIRTAALTALKTYDTTLTVTDAGSGLFASYQVTLNYTAPVQSPVVITRPVAGAHLKVGDSLTVLYSAECVSVPSVTVSLSLNSGIEWSLLTSGGLPCGTGKSFKWKIPPTLTVDGGATVSTVSAQCLIRVHNYAGSGEATTGVFVIDPAESAVSPRLWQSMGSRRFAVTTDFAGALVVTTPGKGRVDVFGLRGERIAGFRVDSDDQAVHAPGVHVQGCSVVRFIPANGDAATTKMLAR